MGAAGVARDRRPARETRDERPVGVLLQALLQLAQHRGEITAKHRVQRQTQSGKDTAVSQVVRVGLKRPVRAVGQLEPVDAMLQGPPDQILAHAVAPVRVELVVEIVRGAAGRDLGDELRRALDVVVVAQPGLSAGPGVDEERRVRLRFVVEIEAHRGVVVDLHARCGRRVASQPGDRGRVRPAVAARACRRRHVDDPFDQLGLLDVGACLVPALELAASQPVAVLERIRG